MNNPLFLMKYVTRLEDEGMRKVMTWQIVHKKTPGEIAKILKIQTSTVETIGKKGALIIKEMLYKEMSMIKGGIFSGQKNPISLRKQYMPKTSFQLGTGNERFN